MLKLFNTLSRQKEEFQPLDPAGKKVGIYSCGPTVYGTPSIGNLRAYIFADTLRRSLEFLGYEVTQVVNITDVGHLTGENLGDANAGEDKLEKGARAAGKTVWEVARFYEQQFLDALDALNIRRPHQLPRATEHIPEQLSMIRELAAKGFTYETSDGIYFDTSKFDGYGKLSGQKLEDKAAGARVAVNDEKRHPADFALWKYCVGENRQHSMRWDFESGTDISQQPQLDEATNRAKKIGFPGWHIECSAMSTRYLGEEFDIHTGGIDHIPVHHENEIAQSECAHGHRFVKYWLHNEFLTVDGGKMSKSLGNLFTIDDIKAKGIDPLAFRLLCLGTHYRQKLNFSWEALMGSQRYLNVIRKRFSKIVNDIEVHQRVPEYASQHHANEHLRGFSISLEDDLNSARCLAEFGGLLLSRDVNPKDKVRNLLIMDEVLGLGLQLSQPVAAESVALTAEQTKLLAEREAARAAKDWAKSDSIRDEFAAAGLEILDTPAGQIVQRK